MYYCSRFCHNILGYWWPGRLVINDIKTIISSVWTKLLDIFKPTYFAMVGWMIHFLYIFCLNDSLVLCIKCIAKLCIYNFSLLDNLYIWKETQIRRFLDVWEQYIWAYIPANTWHRPIGDLLLAQRVGRGPNMKSTLGPRPVLCGMSCNVVLNSKLVPRCRDPQRQSLKHVQQWDLSHKVGLCECTYLWYISFFKIS